MMTMIIANLMQPWNSTIPTQSLIHQCKTQNDINQIHARLITTGFIKNPNFTTHLILKFSSSKLPPLTQFAHYLLLTQHVITQPQNTHFDPFLFNVVIKSFAHGNFDPKQALFVFVFMLSSGFCGDKYSFSLVLKACSRLGVLKQGLMIHGLLTKFDFGSDLYLQNCLVSMYVKCGCVGYARQVFDKMSERDSVSYNAMIDGYVKVGCVGLGRELFDQMLNEERNLITWNTMICGYVQSEVEFDKAWELFEVMPMRDLVSWNLMIDGLVKCRKMDVAIDLFSRMPKRDVFTWSTMIDGFVKIGNLDVAKDMFDEAPTKDIVICNVLMSGYLRSGQFLEALEFFNDITSRDDVFPDKTTLSIVLSAISHLGRIDEGVAVHSFIQAHGFTIDGNLGVSLIDMYSKCGSIENALHVFESLERRNVDHWNAMLGGLAIHGMGELAFELFMKMEALLVKPDDITFIGLLSACGHSGLVKEGQICFELMRRIHNMEPKLHHYGCMVDILSRAGHLEEAKKFIDEMPIEPNEVIWRTLLSACVTYENFHIGQQVADHLFRLGTCYSGSYVLLSNMYAGFGMWDEVNRIRTSMEERALKKLPGCSSIELSGVVHEFLVRDETHPCSSEVYSLLNNFHASGLNFRPETEVTELEFVS